MKDVVPVVSFVTAQVGLPATVDGHLVFVYKG